MNQVLDLSEDIINDTKSFIYYNKQASDHRDFVVPVGLVEKIKQQATKLQQLESDLEKFASKVSFINHEAFRFLDDFIGGKTVFFLELVDTMSKGYFPLPYEDVDDMEYAINFDQNARLPNGRQLACSIHRDFYIIDYDESRRSVEIIEKYLGEINPQRLIEEARNKNRELLEAIRNSYDVSEIAPYL